MKNIVKELPSPEVIKNLLLDTINSSKKPIILTKNYNISKQLLSYYLRQLRLKGAIRKLEKGHWEIVKDYLELTGKRKARGHGFIWNIKLSKEIKGWDKRNEVLTKLNIPYVKAGNTIRIEIRGKKVWLNNKSIIIYENKSFFDSSPLETRKLAIYELIETVRSLESTIKINLGKYRFTTKREHIAWIKDNLAIQCNKDGQKIRVLDKGECWMEIDNSNNEDETEFYKTTIDSAIINSSGYDRHYNSLKKNNWLCTDYEKENFKELNKGLIILTNNQINQSKQITEFSIALNRHIPVYEGMAKQLEIFTKTVNELKEEIKNLKK